MNEIKEYIIQLPSINVSINVSKKKRNRPHIDHIEPIPKKIKI
jgi:hypothetical protein